MIEFVEYIREDGTKEYRNKDYDKIISEPVVVPDDYIKIPEEELAQWNATYYQRSRASEYPSMADQLDIIFHEGLDAWKEQIQAIKDKYPKPE